MRTLTSQMSEKELHEFTKQTVRDAGEGGALLMNDNDLFIIEGEKLFLVKTKEYENINHEISRTELEPDTLYLLFDLFENVIYNHQLEKNWKKL